jgi:hypothetical protein
MVETELSLLQRDLSDEAQGFAAVFWPARMKALSFHLIGVAGKVVSCPLDFS